MKVELVQISVVIPLYNKAEYVTTTLQSVFAQTNQNFEVVVVDDGSTDGSSDVVLSIPEVQRRIKDDSFRLITQKNSGVSAARNKGIEAAKFDYVAFLDADDLWGPNFLFEISLLIREYPEAGIWGTGYSCLTGGKRIRLLKNLPDEFRGIITNPFDGNAHAYCSSAVCCRREALMKIDGFDERFCYGEDLDVWWRIMLKWPAAYYNIDLATYRYDVSERLMLKQKPLEKLYVFYFEKYTEARSKNPSFRHFIDKEAMWWLQDYINDPLYKKDIKRILLMINLREYKLSFRFRFNFPKVYVALRKFINKFHK